MSYFTIETGVDVNIIDIINNIDSFNYIELSALKKAINKTINNSISIESTTLDEYYKIKILKEFFDKYSCEELEEIKKQIK